MVVLAIVTLITSLLCVVNLQLGSQSKTDGNLIIQMLSKDLSIIKVVSKTIVNSKQGSFLGCSDLINSTFPDIEEILCYIQSLRRYTLANITISSFKRAKLTGERKYQCRTL